MNQIILKDLFAHIQGAIQCKEGYKDSHLDAIDAANKLLPHGSGIDGKCEIDIDNCSVITGKEKIYIYFEFHHMSEAGYYDGWTEHNLIITPSFVGYNMRITGKDRNCVKEYLYDLFGEIFI